VRRFVVYKNLMGAAAELRKETDVPGGRREGVEEHPRLSFVAIRLPAKDRVSSLLLTGAAVGEQVLASLREATKKVATRRRSRGAQGCQVFAALLVTFAQILGEESS
jgi:hypothetical protein